MPTVIDLLSLGRSTQHSILLHVEVTEHVIQEGKSGRCIPQPVACCTLEHFWSEMF